MDAKVEKDGFVGEVVLDEIADEHDNPRNWAHTSVMVCEHRNYILGDTKLAELTGYDIQDFMGRETRFEELIERYIRMRFKARAFTWMSMLDHSGLHIYAGSGHHWTDPGGWDSGLIGFAFVPGPGEHAIEAKGELIAEDDMSSEEASDLMYREIKLYDSYIRGEVYGWTVKDPDGDVQESVWGYVGEPEYAESEMKEALERLVKEHKRKEWEKVQIEQPTITGMEI